MTLALPKPIRKMKVPRPLKRSADLGAKRRAAKATGTLTSEQWWRICQWSGFRCSYEGKHAGPLQQHHIEAIARGGTHSAANVCLCCEAHNQRIGTRTVPPTRPGHPFRKDVTP